VPSTTRALARKTLWTIRILAKPWANALLRKKLISVSLSGIGISIAANKVPGIRAALAHDVVSAQLAREHNDANVLALGARIVTPAAALEMVQTFLNTPFAGGRHQRRLDKINQIERDTHL
jgi:ribose 5-phosphate isomerase B